MHPSLITMAQNVSRYVPKGTEIRVAEMIIHHHIHLTITKQRSTKLGDYRPPSGNKGHRISLNHNLNPYSFLITFVHEVAHLICWNRHQNRVAPHGREWKALFRQEIEPFLNHSVFPETVLRALTNYMNNPAASSCADMNLLKALQQHEAPDGLIPLEEVEDDKVFILDGNKRFRKGPLQRKRFKCLNLDNKRYYLVSSLARVRPLEAS